MSSSEEENSDEDEEEYEYSSQDESDNDQGDVAIEIENAYYEADDCQADDPQRALELFEKCVRLETETESEGGDMKYKFKALQHICVLHFVLGNLDAMAKEYENMLNNLGSVTHNERLDAINEVLEAISKASNADIVSKIFGLTLSSLKKSKNDRLWFQTKIKQAKLYHALQQWPRLEKLIGEVQGELAAEQEPATV